MNWNIDDITALQERTPNNSVFFSDDEEVSLNDLEPVDVFSKKARCFKDGSKVPCPDPTVFAKTLPDGSKVTVSTNGAGEIEKIRKQKRNGNKEVLQAVEPDVFTHIPPEAVDDDFFSQFTLKEAAVDNLRRSLKGQLRGTVNTKSSARNLQSACTQYKEIELAVEVESSFCSAVGRDSTGAIVRSLVDAKVQSIVYDVAQDYQQDGLCFTVRMSHYEPFCDPNDDPYKPGVDLNQSGCGNTGL